MYFAARTANCNYRPFNQMELLQSIGYNIDYSPPGGLCYGLSTRWLYRKSKNTGTTFLDDVRVWDRRPDFQASAALQQVQLQHLDDKEMLYSAINLQLARDSSGNEKEETFNLPQHDGQAAAIKFAEWIAKSATRRYFLVSVPRHRMAAVGSRFGKLEFFDPNGGIVTTRSTSHMAQFLHAYFNREDVKRAYRSIHGFVQLTVTKLKAA